MLTADNRSRGPNEPDGTAETLWGKINPKAFGDRVLHAKPGGEAGEAKKCVLLLALACARNAAAGGEPANATAPAAAVPCAFDGAWRAC